MSNENSKLEYETGVTPFLMSALSNSGDNKTFSSQAALFSASQGNGVTVRPNGVLTGGAVTPSAAATNNAIDIATLSCNLAGVITAISAATDTTITRPATNVASVSSITISSAGSIAVIKGTDGASTTFSEARGTSGAPPFIPVGSIEIAQVRVTSSASAAIAATEIFQVVGTHLEKADFPVYTIDNATGSIIFNTALPLIHTASVPKAVYAAYSEPVFVEQSFANDFVATETSHSTSSTQVYGDTVGTTSSSLGQGSFTAILSDGITDGIVSRKNDTLWFRYYQDKYKPAHLLTQGKLGISRTFAASEKAKVSCTISADKASIERAN